MGRCSMRSFRAEQEEDGEEGCCCVLETDADAEQELGSRSVSEEEEEVDAVGEVAALAVRHGMALADFAVAHTDEGGQEEEEVAAGWRRLLAVVVAAL
mmetsp:Transcript_47794/g.95740  ORF Transcript_47794/g.95740 Transcript_47794/m.95740 type:complete len:98 (-) Transcript_47794:430-723(-)